MKKNQLNSRPGEDSDFLLKLKPLAITTARSRRAAALVFAVSVVLLGLPASFAGIGEMWAVLVSAVIGSVVVYNTWSVKTTPYNQHLDTQDLVNLIAHMKENPEREGIFLNYLACHSLNLWELTYADVNLLIKQTSHAGDQVD